MRDRRPLEDEPLRRFVDAGADHAAARQAIGDDTAVDAHQGRIPLVLGDDRGEPFLVADTIVIGEDDGVGAAGAHRDVSRDRYAHRIGRNIAEPLVVDRRQRFLGFVVGALIDDDQLEVGDRIRQDAFDRAPDLVGPVPRRNRDRQRGNGTAITSRRG